MVCFTSYSYTGAKPNVMQTELGKEKQESLSGW